MKAVLHVSTPPSSRRYSRTTSFVMKALPAALALAFLPAGWADPLINAGGAAASLPVNGSVHSGTANGSVSGNQLTVNQSTARAVIDWSSFNIGVGNTVQFVQPTGGAVLNRVSAATDASQIAGTLSANGMVMLMNPHGVLFHGTSSVNVGALIATTGTIDENTFSNTGAQITGATAGIITNQGSITATAGASGLVAMVAPSVINQGVIAATGGTIALLGSTAATISLNSGLYEFAIPGGATGTAVTNAAGASLNAATIHLGVGDAANLLSGVINLEGVQQASSAIVVNGDTVVLKSALQAPSVGGSSNTVNVSGAARIQDGVNIVKSGGAVNVAAGTYVQPGTLKIDKSLTLSGAGEGATIIDARGVTNYGMHVTGDNVTLKDFTLYGPSANVSASYGIKVAPSGGTSARLQNFAIRNVTIRGSGRAELDLNGVVGAQIDHVTADGAPVGNDTGSTAGAGIQITDSANVTVTNSVTRNNQWGGLALYQANRFHDQQVNNITVDGSNSFTELNPVYLQDESANKNFGTLSISGFDHAVRNSSSTNSNHQYTWLQASQQKAFDFAVNLGAAASSYVQVWDGAQATQNFKVGTGHLLAGGDQAMSIGTAIDAAGTGATVNVAAGTYSENVIINKALTLDGAGMGQTILKAPSATAGNAVSINASNVTLSDLSINDSLYGVQMQGTSNNVTIDRVAFNNNQYSVRNGTAVKADNFRMLNSSITGGLVGVQTYNSYNAGTGLANGSFKNALFENVTVDGTTFKGFYFETADNLTMRNVTITNAGNIGDPNSHLFGAAIDVNLKYGAYGSINFGNVVVKSSGSATSAAVVIKTRGIPGDGSDYTRSPASLQSVNITGGSIEDSAQAGIRFETLSNGSGGQPTVTISGTQFKNNPGDDIVVDNTRVDARGAVFVGAADGFAIEDRVTHALDTAGRGLVTWKTGNVYVTQNSGSIQRGVDAAGIGDTVNVANASFAENVTVNARRDLTFNDTRLQSLTLGSGAAGTGIGGTVTADGAGGFDFHKDASIRLLSDTTLATMGADISIKGDIQNAGNVARALKLIAGSGGTRGNVYMNTGGSEAKPLGHFDVSANNFKLDSTLWVSGYKIDALGNVALSNSTLRAQDTGAASTLSAGGDVTGSTISLGSVEIASGGNIVANITATDIVATAQGSMDVVLNASKSATLESGGPTNASGFAPVIAIDAPSGTLSGGFGAVTNTGGGLINVNGKPQGSQTLSSNTENNRVIPAGGVLDSDAEGGAVQVAQTGDLARQGESGISLSTPEAAGNALDNGQSVELDMSPRKQREQNNKKEEEKEQGE